MRKRSRFGFLMGVGVAVSFLFGACSGGEVVTTSAPPSVATTSSSLGVSTTATEPPASSSTVPAPATTTTIPAPAAADIVFTGGDVVTMDPALGTVQAIAISGEVIAAVGTAEEIQRFVGPDTIVVDLQGRAVGPGFVDAHTHILTDMGGIAAGQVLALENGFTSIGDASIEPGLPELFIEAANSGELRVRTTLYLARTDPCGDDQGTWYEQFAPDAVLAPRVRIGGVKIFADGGVCGQLAVSEPFLAGYENGVPYQDLDLLTSWIRDADAAGYQVIIHAQGDLAIERVQDAYAAVLDGQPNTRRHRIEHNAFITETVAKRYGELGLVPTVFGISSACIADIGWTDFYKEFGDRPGTIGKANPGLVVAWHGDDPALPPISPILELFGLVTRNNVAEDGTICEAPEWMRGGGVTVEQGLAMMTMGSAYALRQDDVVGSLTPGKFADLVVLSDNLLAVPADELPTVQILATMIGGVIEYCAPGSQDMCPRVLAAANG
ncbi:MAG: amidohydrolase family protein [Acidobacteria bacterium]|nr:amidohydrolase family protein [Acidobacteriota bacterium]